MNSRYLRVSSNHARDGPRSGNKTCRHFQQGHCSFGSKCRFSHDPSASQAHPPFKKAQTLNRLSEGRPDRGKYKTWRASLRRNYSTDRFGELTSVWRVALELLQSDDQEQMQLIPKDLEDNNLRGRECIEATMSFNFDPGMTSSREEVLKMWHFFLDVITHHAFVNCLSVDTQVGALYNYISGTNGRRVMSFSSRFVKEVTKDLQNSDMAEETLSLVASFVGALREVLIREIRAVYHEQLPCLLDKIQNEILDLNADRSSQAIGVIARTLRDIRAMIDRAQGMLGNANDECSWTVDMRSRFPKELTILPTNRHDNDYMDINQISIIPTVGEIVSEEREFLPSTDFSEPHFLQGAERHIDTHFRLLRHDIFGEMTTALKGYLGAAKKTESEIAGKHAQLGSVRAFSYLHARLNFVSFHRNVGLEAQIRFLQPSSLRKMAKNAKSRWWNDSRRLEEGVLVCLVLREGREVRPNFFTVSKKSVDPKNQNSLTHHDTKSTITCKLLSKSTAQINQLLNLYYRNTEGLLIEFPSLVPETFVHVLANLQQMHKISRLPFREWIVPSIVADEDRSMLPPLYSRKTNFVFSFDYIVKDKSDAFSIASNSSADDKELLRRLESTTSLDPGQCHALLAALTREYSLIQGPPGTGKTFLGVELLKVLVHAKRRARLGPIVIVCYTNHALDQFLERLLDAGIQKIIRIGGSSNSDRLEGHNLRSISRGNEQSGFERYHVATTIKRLDTLGAKISKVLFGLKSPESVRALRYHISRHHPAIDCQFTKTDEDGFELAGKADPFERWVKEALKYGTKQDDKMTPLDEQSLLIKATTSVVVLNMQERKTLIMSWARSITETGREKLQDMLEETNTLRTTLSTLYDESDRRTLQRADVIGITTTGLAKRVNTLKSLGSKIVVCEEAAEVLEAHIMTALLPGVEHFIQIGDHLQLRPQINNFGLSLESSQGRSFKLDRSQFERLSVGEHGICKVPVAQLNVQRRMRPEISNLIRQTMYPNLKDDVSILNYPDVVGMRRNVFWLDHNYQEAEQDSEHQSKSHHNDWEAEYVHALIRHIVRQGAYSSQDIAVLTPYTGQLQKLRRMLSESFEIVLSDRDENQLITEGFEDDQTLFQENEPDDYSQGTLLKKKMSDLLRVATVDNFQGEEAKIIIVSLVRSNAARKVGFLRTTNRINVLLSRAMHGLYLIGNAETYTNVPMWADVIHMLQAQDAVGAAIGLCCPRHKDTEIQARKPEDFERFSPEGGCQLACAQRLSCGHKCPSRCHSNAMHRVVNCQHPCTRYHKLCGHACQKPTCGEACGVCSIELDGVKLPCGHLKDSLPCHKKQNLESVCCTTKVNKMVPECGHIVTVLCSQDVTSEDFKCTAACNSVLECGHICTGTCGTCYKYSKDEPKPVVTHSSCKKVCNRPFNTCNHSCKKLCHGKDCGSCVSDCQVKCPHSKCDQECRDVCAPCIEKCVWGCEHQGSCNLPCSAPCDRLPCNRRCSMNLSCGHQCPGLCGEECPEGYCHICTDKADARVDFLEMLEYRDINPDETPVVVLACGHFFTAESLDGIVGMSRVYEEDNNGNYVKLREIPSDMTHAIPPCPDCKRPIQQYVTRRYNRAINQAIIDEMTKKFVMLAKAKLASFDELISRKQNSMDSFEEDLSKVQESGDVEHMTRETPKAAQMDKDLRKIESGLSLLQNELKKFLTKWSDQNQPVQKLQDAILRSRSASLEDNLKSLSLQEPSLPHSTQIHAKGQVLLIKVRYIHLNLRQRLARHNYRALNKQSLQNDLLKDLEACLDLAGFCRKNKLPRVGVDVAIYYSGMAAICRSVIGGSLSKEHIDTAKAMLEEAESTCTNTQFSGSHELLQIVQRQQHILVQEFYEVLTTQELDTIKLALIEGRGGIATHSGHWYNCENGHPFVIGECGMPMERARCPECGATIGGQDHRAVAGVTRAAEME